MRDWRVTLRPASFRGVPFKVDVEQMGGARRLSVSPIAYAETSVIEDMGRDPSTWSLTAYQAGEMADLQTLPLIAALEAKGPGLAVLPMLGARMVRITGWSLSREKWRHGFVALDVQMIEEGLSAVPFAPMAAGALISSVVQAGLAIAGAALVRAASGATSSGMASMMETVSAARSRAVASAGLTGSEGNASRAVSDALSRLASAGGAASTDPAEWASAQIDAWRAIGQHNDADRAAPQSLQILAGLDQTSPAATIERAGVLCGFAIAAARKDHKGRADAQSDRAALSAASALVLDAVSSSLDGNSFSWLSAVTGSAAMEISRAAANRAPLVRVETGISMPSVVLAHALYNDASRAGELVDRNATATPAFMPVSIEAAAA